MRPRACGVPTRLAIEPTRRSCNRLPGRFFFPNSGYCASLVRRHKTKTLSPARNAKVNAKRQSPGGDATSNSGGMTPTVASSDSGLVALFLRKGKRG